MNTCPICGLKTRLEHKNPSDCVLELKARLEHDSPTFCLSNRKLRFIRHPDADPGEYVLIAGVGEGTTLFTESKHELALCLDEDTRQRLIALLQGEPE